MVNQLFNWQGSEMTLALQVKIRGKVILFNDYIWLQFVTTYFFLSVLNREIKSFAFLENDNQAEQ